MPTLDQLKDDPTIDNVSGATIRPNDVSGAGASFRTGDVAQLRSGGPQMVLGWIANGSANCYWTDGSGSDHMAIFPTACLRRVNLARRDPAEYEV